MSSEFKYQEAFQRKLGWITEKSLIIKFKLLKKS